MLSTLLLILALAATDEGSTLGSVPETSSPPDINSAYSIGLERVAPRILFDRCRVEMVGDSETNHAGVTSTHAEARFHHGALRTFRPRHWRGCTIPAYVVGSYNGSGWYYQPNPGLGYRQILTDADRAPPVDTSKRTAIGHPGIFSGILDDSIPGFHAEALIPLEFTANNPSSDWAHRVSIPFVGRYIDRVWRSGVADAPSPNQFLEPGARIKWQAWQYVSDLTTTGTHPYDHNAAGPASIVGNLALRPTSLHPAFGWTDVGNQRRVEALATIDRPVRTVWQSIEATLTADGTPPASGASTDEPLGPGIEVVPPPGETWGTLSASTSHAVLLVGGFSVERMDQDGLFLASLGNDGSRTVNHLYEPQDTRTETSFHPGSGVYNGYTDDALLARYERFETDTVFILLGVNDSNHAMDAVRSPASFVSNIEGIMARHRRLHRVARSRNDAIQPLRFVIFTQPDWDDGPRQRARISKYASGLKSLPFRHVDVAVVDLHARWRDEFGSYEDYEEFSLADGAHPTRIGQDSFARMAWSEIVRAEYGCDIVDPDGDGEPDCESCRGDMDADGVVGGRDFGIFLLNWSGEDARADLNGDGHVDQEDLGMLLTLWGPCP